MAQIGNLPAICVRQDDVPHKLSWKEGCSHQAQGGDGGCDFISDTSAHEGVWASFQAVGGDVVIADATFENCSGSINGKTIKDGQRVFAPLRSVTLTSGTLQCIKAIGH